MKRTILSLCFSLLFLASYAVPAERGIMRKIKLADGKQIMVELRGDEFVHFWEAGDGTRYLRNAERFVPTNDEQIAYMANERRSVLLDGHASPIRKANASQRSAKPIVGKKKGLIILVQFPDVKFSMADPNAYFNRVANEQDVSIGKQKGSLRDYFLAQSNGQFELDFDIAGPYTLGQPSSYYGADDEYSGHDQRAGDMICQGALAAAGDFNMADYDWDGDGEVEQIFVLYAGEGQATSGVDDQVWPHKSNISAWSYSGHKPLTLDGVKVDVYACSNEMRGGFVAGIGTICHEFSHCLGFPDMYDTTHNSGATKTNYGMGTWDLMNSGNYNGSSYVPAGYTSWEKWVAGWITPIELKGDMRVADMKPMSQNGDAYIVYNQGNRNEYYLFENRKKEGWDNGLSGEGMLILHVDYDSRIFGLNCPNTFVYGNDRQRMTIFHADNSDGLGDEQGDPFPQPGITAFSNTTTPAAAVYNRNSDGSNFMNISLSRITRNNDGYISFFFGDANNADSSILLSETFDKCVGTGANDNNWMTFKVGVGSFVPDMEGWMGSYMMGAYHCARFGDKASTASVTSPEFTVDGEAVLEFRAAPYAKEGTMVLEVKSDNPDVALSETKFQLVEKEWTDCKATITGKGKLHLNFTPDCRLYLDDVLVTSTKQTDAINEVSLTKSPYVHGIYNMNGQQVEKMQRGIYIKDGRKVLVK